MEERFPRDESLIITRERIRRGFANLKIIREEADQGLADHSRGIYNNGREISRLGRRVRYLEYPEERPVEPEPQENYLVRTWKAVVQYVRENW